MTSVDEHELETHDSSDAEPTPVRASEEKGPFSETSIVDTLQAEMRELADSREVYIPVKGYEKTGLQICYHLPLSGKELDDISTKVRREVKDNYSRNLTTAIDTMIHLCSGIYVQPAGVNEPVMLDPDNTGEPCTFDQQLAEILGMEGQVTSARQIVRKLFGNNDMATISHAEKLSRWLSNTKADLSLELWQQGE